MEENKYKQSNRMTIIGFLLIFAIPIISAWSAYFGGWFTGIETTNKGEWVTPIVEFKNFNPVYADQQSYLMTPGEKWKLLIPASVTQCQDEQTDSLCLINLFVISQTHIALGKNIERVEKVLFNGSASYDDLQLKALKERFVDLRIVNSSAPASEQLPDSYIYIADPLGNIMLRYKMVERREDMPLIGKDIHTDIKKLLKLSRLD